jgi:hypothetical protein
MKINKFIMGCALAAGLTTFAYNKAQAVVIGDELYVPLHITATAYFESIADKLAHTSIDSKDIVNLLGFPKTDQLAYNVDSGDVWVIDKTNTVYNMTLNGYLDVDLEDPFFDFGVDDDSEVGIIDVDFYSSGDESEDSAVWFIISGFYVFTESETDTTEKVSISAGPLNGDGHDSDVSEDTLPVRNGSLSGSSKGTIEE